MNIDLAEVAHLNDWLEQFRSRLSQANFDDIKLCLNEIITNAISYGFPSREAEGEIGVAVDIKPNQIVATVVDNGIAFNPLEAPVQQAISDIETAQIGGFGLMLVRKTASSLSYIRDSGQNRLTMAFEINQAEPSVP